MFNRVFVSFLCSILGQVWYLIVSIPDLCNLSYFGPSIYCLPQKYQEYKAYPKKSWNLATTCTIFTTMPTFLQAAYTTPWASLRPGRNQRNRQNNSYENTGRKNEAKPGEIRCKYTIVHILQSMFVQSYAIETTFFWAPKTNVKMMGKKKFTVLGSNCLFI